MADGNGMEGSSAEMAILNGYQSFRMWDVPVYYGVVTVANATTIIVEGTVRSSVYVGEFTYDAFNNVYGEVTAYGELYYDVVAVEAYGFSVDASLVQAGIQNGDANTLIALAARGDDIANGSAFDDSIAGFAGDDRLFGNGGADVIFGDHGNDRVVGGSGNDYLNGGPQHDTLVGNSGFDVLVGGGGNDNLNGGGQDDDLNGGGGNDNLNAAAGSDRRKGGGGADILNGGGGNDRLFGGGGGDQLNGGRGNDILTGNAGPDTFIFRARDGNDRITDFRGGVDEIAVLAGADGFGDLEISDVRGGALIEYARTSILLSGVDASSLDEGDFVF